MKLIEEIRKDMHTFSVYECFLTPDRDSTMLPNLVLWVPMDTVFHTVQMQISEEAQKWC